MSYKILDSINIFDVLLAYKQLESTMEWTTFVNKGRQTGLQYKQGDDYWTSGVDKSRGEEFKFDNLNPFFKNTIFEDIINKYNLKRTRLMWVNQYACYSIHKDYSPRIHIPLITNPECYFFFRDEGIRHLPTGSIYWVDTTKPHTFLNCSETDRLHLVGVVEN
jgi:hypothetical protein